MGVSPMPGFRFQACTSCFMGKMSGSNYQKKVNQIGSFNKFEIFIISFLFIILILFPEFFEESAMKFFNPLPFKSTR